MSKKNPFFGALKFKYLRNRLAKFKKWVHSEILWLRAFKWCKNQIILTKFKFWVTSLTVVILVDFPRKFPSRARDKLGKNYTNFFSWYALWWFFRNYVAWWDIKGQSNVGQLYQKNSFWWKGQLGPNLTKTMQPYLRICSQKIFLEYCSMTQHSR